MIWLQTWQHGDLCVLQQVTSQPKGSILNFGLAGPSVGQLETEGIPGCWQQSSEATWLQHLATQTMLKLSSCSAGPSVGQLETEGIPRVLAAEQRGDLAARHPWLYAQAPDLPITRVPDLLTAYKVCSHWLQELLTYLWALITRLLNIFDTTLWQACS